MLRTHKLNEVNEKLIGKNVILTGWVDSVREHGNVVFIDLRDRYGKVQSVISKKTGNEFEKAKKLTMESCIALKGEVKQRPKGTENKELDSGKVEVSINEIEIYNLCEMLPFKINDKETSEDIRLRYRFLDLRSKRMQKNLLLRNKTLKIVRDFFYDEGFAEIETPILAKSTPEGARDYIVPSRNYPGKFYALPQSPQLFKQLTQIGGFDKYIQIAKCFRDEDLRSDRQPEFTQIDVEMSFIEQEDIINLIEKMIKRIFKEVLNEDVKIPFKRLSYKEAIKKYKSDKPDLRKEMKKKYAFCWVVDFPLFEYSEEEARYKSMHHPFTMPNMKDFEKNPEKAKSLAYDLVLNGVELGGGSIRIHNPEIQKKIFEILGISKKQAQEKFGFLLKALSFGAPPHGGIAFGLDRLLAMMAGEDSIREVIAFPKNKEAKDVMLDAPSEISKAQLKDVHLKVDLPKKKK
ncbi:aspartate--tRNA ligase [Candidatus Pacearchaeota archaeon]|nr:MAG: aspartate--tRNA ligase [Candidatus Pacearchaeota archaeon]